jgi:hypothetical protein
MLFPKQQQQQHQSINISLGLPSVKIVSWFLPGLATFMQFWQNVKYH